MKIWLRTAVVLCLLCIPAALLAADYRVILQDGSWVRSSERPVRVDGKAQVRLPAGQLVVLPESRVNWEKTEAWNAKVEKEHITTALPLPRSILYLPVVVASPTGNDPASNLPREGEDLTAGDPAQRLHERMRILDAEVSRLSELKKEMQRRSMETESTEVRAGLSREIDALDARIRALRAERNGLSLQLLGWER